MDDFNYGETIYEGENSKVVKVTHKKTSKIYAVKMIVLRLKYENKTKSKIEEKENRIQTEVRFYEKFSNMLEGFTFYPEYHGYFKEVSMLGLTTYHIFFNYYQKTLKSAIRKKILCTDFQKIKNYFYQLIETLAFLQSCGIANRDIKPENVLLDDKEEKLFLTDFGIAVKIKEMVHNGKFSGTYYSPEWMKLRYEQKEEDPSAHFNLFTTDSFNLGLVTLEMGGVSVDFSKNTTFDEYVKDLEGKIGVFKDKFEKEIKETVENQEFLSDLESLLRVNPHERADFLKIFVPRWKFENEEKVKYNILIEDMNRQEIVRFSVKKIQIMKEIYESLDGFLISLESKQMEENFTKLVKKRHKLIEKLSWINYPKALFFRGIQFKFGLNVEKNVSTAKELFEKALELEENAYSLYLLGTIYDEKKDYQNSFKFYEKSSNLKNAFGMLALGHAYMRGNGCKADSKKGFSLADHASKYANESGFDIFLGWFFNLMG